LESFLSSFAVENSPDIEATLPVVAARFHTQGITAFDYYQTMHLHILPNSAALSRTLQNLC
jgi:hypothetical protein